MASAECWRVFASSKHDRLWDDVLGEYILDWDQVLASQDPRGTALEFARSVFRHACVVCAWDPGLAASADETPPPVR